MASSTSGHSLTFTVQDIDQASKDLNIGKANDAFGLSAEHLKLLSTKGQATLASIFNSILPKGGESQIYSRHLSNSPYQRKVKTLKSKTITEG